MSKRIAALFCAVLLLVFGSVPVHALIAVQDQDGNVYYSSDEQDAAKPTFKTKAKAAFRNALNRAKDFWQRRGVLTVAILVIVCILGTVVVLTIEDEKKKKQAIEKQPKKKHKE